MIKIKDVIAISKKKENKQLEKQLKSAIKASSGINLKEILKELKECKIKLCNRSSHDSFKSYLLIEEPDSSKWTLLLSISIY